MPSPLLRRWCGERVPRVLFFPLSYVDDATVDGSRGSGDERWFLCASLESSGSGRGGRGCDASTQQECVRCEAG